MDNHEMYRVVSVDIPLKSYSRMIDRYTELEMAMKSIESIRDVQIIFIVSNNLAQEALSQLKSHRHVRDLFILNNSSKSLNIDVNQHDSSVGIFNNENELTDAIETKIVSIEKQVLPFSVFDQTQRTSKDLSNEFNSFLWYQVLFHTLKQMPADEQAKEDMLKVCSDYYQQNHRQEQIIQQYRESSDEDQAIHWYTKDTFFFKLANQALRSEDMLLVYQFRHWIKQLCSAIECEHRKQKEDSSWKLYRGFQLHKEEFERLKKSIGNLISINSFLSTTYDIDVARAFAGEGTIEGSLVSVLLQIEVNPVRLQSVFFANISHLSQYRDENEVLFSLGSTFRIQSIDFVDKLWIVQLNGSDDGSDRIDEYCQLANYNFHSTLPMIYFGRVLNENLDQTERSVRYFRELLKFVGEKDPELAEIYDALGDAYARRNEISQSVECYKIERKIQKKQGTQPIKADEKILRMKLIEEEQKTNEPTLNKADLLCQLADSTNYAQAEIYCNQALQIYEELSPSSPLVNTCMEQLIWIYGMNHKYQKRLDLDYRRLTIEEQYLPIDNQKLNETLTDIMNNGITPDDHQRFINYCQTQMPILRQSLDENHHRLVHMQQCLDDVQDKLEDFEEKHNDWINDLQNINEKDVNQRIQFYFKLSTFYFRHGLFNESVKHSFDQLKICQNIDRYNPMEIIEIFERISLCYQEMFNYSEAFVYMIKRLEFAQSIEHIDPKIIDDIRNRIDNFVRSAAKHQIELPWIPTSPDDPDIPW